MHNPCWACILRDSGTCESCELYILREKNKEETDENKLNAL